MKDLISKLTELEATAPKQKVKKMLSEDSTKPPMNAETEPTRLKDIFETMVSGQPIPVVGKQGDTAQTGAGFINVTDTSPAAQALSKAVGDLAGQKKLQIVVPTQTGQAKPGQPAAPGATGQVPAGATAMKEKWDAETKVAPSEKGKYAGKDKAELTKAYNKLKASGPHKKGSPEFGKMRELAFAIRAKSGWGKVQEEQLDEKLTKSMSAGDVISDFEKSKDPKFKGKSKEERKKMALGAYYGMHPEKSKKKKTDEADIPSTNGIDTMGAGLGAGRSQTTLEGKEPQVEVIDNAFNRENYKDLIGKKYPKSKAPAYARVKEVNEGKKPDFLDLDKDGNKKESMKKAAADKKKKKVDESMNHRISAARLEGKSHGLRGHAHSGKRYEDLEEMKAYHEGYKEGLDECYGMGIYETAPAMPAATVPGMANAAMEAELDEMDKSEYMKHKARTTPGDTFKAFGQTMHDKDVLEADLAFESWDRELENLLSEGTEVTEGLSVSVSKGQQNAPDSVTITAQDHEADELLKLVKSAGLGLFADEEPTQSMSVQPDHSEPHEIGTGGASIDVVDGDDMLSLMKKIGGVEAAGANDYADEEDCGCDEPTNEETCNECGYAMEEGHDCGSKQMVDEVESEDQMEFEVAEDNAPDSETAEHNADEEAEAEEDMALAKAAQQNKTTTVNEGGDGGEASEEGPESKEGETDEEGETVSESFTSLLHKLSFLSEESQSEEDDKAEKAGKKVAKDIEHDEGHKGKDDDKAEKAGKEVTKDIEYDDKKDKKEKVDEWANQVGSGPGKGTDASFEQDIDFMTKVIAGGLNKPKSTGQTTIPVIAGQEDRMHDNPQDWATLAGIKK